MGFTDAPGLSKIQADARYIDAPGYDLILLWGQSNMSGRGTPFDTVHTDPINPRVWQWGASGTYAGMLTQAIEPLAMHDTPSGIGPGSHFARWYLGLVGSNRQVMLVPSAHGGVPLSSNVVLAWRRGGVAGNLYAQAIAQAQAALAAAGPNSRIVGMLWHQGETDGDNSVTGTQYQTDLDALIDGVRTDLSLPNLPVIVGQMVPDYIPSGGRAAINTVHAATPARKPNAGFAYGLPGVNMADGNHFNAVGQRFLARAMFDQFAAVIGRASAPTVPAQVTGLTAGTATGSTQVLTWAAAAGAISYTVQYRLSPSGTWTTATSVSALTATVQGLSPTTAYDFRVLAYNSAGAATASATVTATTSTQPVYVSDTFTRANSTTTLGTAETGGAWTAVAGVWGITSNQAYEVSGTNGMAEINSGVSDGTVKVTMAGLPTGVQSRLLFRGDGTINNYWMLQFRTTTQKYQLYKVVAGATTQVGSDLGVVPAAGDVLAIILAGSSVTVTVNGTTALTATDSALSTSTWHGMGMNSFDAAAKFDNFSVSAT